jgi:hypothetical protein
LGAAFVHGDRDRCAAGCIRVLLERPDPACRELLAAYAGDYIRAFLTACRSRWRFGFSGTFDDMIEEVGDVETAALLRVAADEEGRDALPGLRLALRKLDVARADDMTIVLAFRGLLRTRAHQGAIARWKREHPDEALFLRSVKLRLRDARGIWIHKDARGQFLVTARSNLRLPCMQPAELVDVLRACGPRYRPVAVLAVLRKALAPTPPHGGVCYLMDVVRTVHALRAEIVETDPGGTGAIPHMEGSPLSRDRTPRAIWLARTRAVFEEAARTILGEDGGDPGAPTREAWIRISVELTLRPFGLGDCRLDGLSQLRMIERLLPGSAQSGDVRAHVNGTNYLTRRLRVWARRNRALLARSLWRRWLERTEGGVNG